MIHEALIAVAFDGELSAHAIVFAVVGKVVSIVILVGEQIDGVAFPAVSVLVTLKKYVFPSVPVVKL